MKKIIIIILSFFTIFLLFNISNKKVYALSYNTIIEAVDKDSNVIKLLEDENKLYTITLNDRLGLTLDIDKREFKTIFYSETSNYYFLYGSIKYDLSDKRENEHAILIRIPKSFENFKLLIKEPVEHGSKFKDLFEFYDKDYFAVLFIDRAYTYSQSETYIYLFDNNFEIVRSRLLETHECTISVFYNLIQLKSLDQDASVTYLNSVFGYDGKEYDKTEEINGCLQVCSNMYVNGEKAKIGDTYTIPGRYTLSNDGLKNKIIDLKPIVNGLENNKYYDDFVEYSISGGNIYLNDELSFNSGSLSTPGKYNLKIVGINGYSLVYNFVIKPKLYTNIVDGGTLNIGDTLTFSGSAKLNNEIIYSGKKIESPGTYRFVLFIDDLVFETIEFTVNEETIKEENKKTSLFIFLSLLILTIGISLIFIIRESQKRKEK